MANNQPTFFGHPIGLSTLFATEMWERFSYYGMRALLVLFLISGVEAGGFGLSREEAYTIYGIFTFLVYVTPLIGGLLADKLLGQRVTIYIGGLIMAIGQFMLAASSLQGADMETRQFWFFAGLGVLVLGNGFFKPNISTMVGCLYDDNDPRKDGGFTLFYMGINLGAFIAPLVAGYLGENVSWEYGYLSAGVGMLIGVLWFMVRSEKTLGTIGLPPKAKAGSTNLEVSDWVKVVVYTVAVIGGVVGFMALWGFLSPLVQNIVIWTVGLGGGGYLVSSIVRDTDNSDQWMRVFVILVLAFFNIFFWVGFEQAGTTFNIFALENTNRMLFGYEIPASWFQSLNPIFIVVLAPVFSMLWMALGSKNLNPRTPFKFAWGMGLLSVGAAVMAIADTLSNGGDAMIKVSPMWLTAVYLIFTAGELCISPIGLSMVAKLSPPKLTSTLMGIWFFSTSAGNFGASQATKLSSAVEGVIGQPVNVFWFVAVITAVATLCLFALGPWLCKMMKGID